MKIVVDTNIVFSALINTQSRIADLLMNSLNVFDFYWTGDKQLIKGLEAKGYTKLLTTDKLQEIRRDAEQKRKSGLSN